MCPEVPGYTFYQSVNNPGNDISGDVLMGSYSVSDVANLCSTSDVCVAFVVLEGMYSLISDVLNLFQSSAAGLGVCDGTYVTSPTSSTPAFITVPSPPPVPPPKPPLPPPPQMQLTLFSNTSALSASFPQVSVTVPVGYKIISGGAAITGCFLMWLTSSSPVINGSGAITAWSAAAVSHGPALYGFVTAYAVALHDPGNLWDVVTTSQTSGAASWPSHNASVHPGYTLVGGGAYDPGSANMLVSSLPLSDNMTWASAGGDSNWADEESIQAFAIGVRYRATQAQPACSVRSVSTSSASNYPSLNVTASPGSVIVGGGGGQCTCCAWVSQLQNSPDGKTFYAAGSQVDSLQKVNLSSAVIECKNFAAAFVRSPPTPPLPLRPTTGMSGKGSHLIMIHDIET